MLHARPDYMRIQDPSGLIPQDEPVFLLRAQDKTAALVVEVWAAMQPDGPLALMGKRNAETMRVWGETHPGKLKWADITPDQRNEVHGPAPVGVVRDYVAEIAHLKRQLTAAAALAAAATAAGRQDELRRALESSQLSNAPAGGVVRDYVAEIARLKRQLTEAEDQAADLDRKHAAAGGMYEEAIRERGVANERLDAMERLLDNERAAAAEAVRDRCAAYEKLDALRQSVLAAGCVELEVCSDCGSPADGSGCNPCKLPFTERRLVNRRAEDAVRERDSLRAELSTERRSHNRRMAALVTLKFEFDTLKRQLSRSNHNMDATGQCSADCPACEEVRWTARAEAADALDHLRTCPPNMCREGHPEIRYEQLEDGPLDCPLCRSLADHKAQTGLLERFFNKRTKEVLEGTEWECGLCSHNDKLQSRAVRWEFQVCLTHGYCIHWPKCVVVPLTFRRLQSEQRPWMEHNFPGHPSHIPLLGALEELGELAHAHIKQDQGIRGTTTELEAAARDAIADTVIYLSDYCTARGFDFQALMEEVWDKVKQRDWKADPATSGSGELSNRQSNTRYTEGTHADH